MPCADVSILSAVKTVGKQTEGGEKSASTRDFAGWALGDSFVPVSINFIHFILDCFPKALLLL